MAKLQADLRSEIRLIRLLGVFIIIG